MLKTLASAVLLGAALFEGAFAERSFGQKVRDRNHQRANRAVASVQETGNLEERASSMRYLNKKTKRKETVWDQDWTEGSLTPT